MLSSRLLEAIFRTAETLPQASLENVASVLETEATLSPTLRGRVLSSVALSQERVLLSALLREWEDEKSTPTAITIAAALRSAAYTQAALKKEEQIDLVWTGPTVGTVWRRTDQALLQVIQSAQHELLLVTFAAYRMPLLLEALRQAIHRGVEIRFVAEAEDTGKVQLDPAKAFADLSTRMRFFIWPREKRIEDGFGKFGSLHAKCALADENLLLVSSANLTDHAMLLNMEIGLLVSGGPLPCQVKHHFARLIVQDVLREVF